MDNKTRIVPALLVVMLALVSLGCHASGALFPTPTPTSTATPTGTPTPTSTPTRTPTVTPTPMPDLSRAVLTLADLPPGFEVMDAADLRYTSSAEDTEARIAFSFVNHKQVQMVFGSVFLFAKKVDRHFFDEGLARPEGALEYYVRGFGGEDVEKEKLLEGLYDVGDRRVGVSMLGEFNRAPVQVEILLFRRGSIGAEIISIVSEGSTPHIGIHDLGLELDKNIKELLRAGG